MSVPFGSYLQFLKEKNLKFHGWLVGWLVAWLLLQGQRLIELNAAVPAAAGGGAYTVAATAPPSAVIAPAAYYMLFAVSEGIPSVAQWVHVGWFMHGLENRKSSNNKTITDRSIDR
jgi:hypothetical protein